MHVHVYIYMYNYISRGLLHWAVLMIANDQPYIGWTHWCSDVNWSEVVINYWLRNNFLNLIADFFRLGSLLRLATRDEEAAEYGNSELVFMMGRPLWWQFNGSLEFIYSLQVSWMSTQRGLWYIMCQLKWMAHTKHNELV